MVEIDTIYDWDRNEHNFQKPTNKGVCLLGYKYSYTIMHPQTNTHK